jgi:sugar phosphate isomerase/epimerase
VAISHLGLLIYSLGIKAKAAKEQGISHPLQFLRIASQYGASAVQLPLSFQADEEGRAIRRESERLNVKIEGIISPPKDAAKDLDRFSAELTAAKACGADIVRTVMLGGRRYEVFEKPEDFVAFAKNAEASLLLAAKIADKQRVTLAVENHKDFRTDELVDLLKRVSSEWVGVCLDTGNNLALLEDPNAVAEALAPWTRTVHLKDIGTEEAATGFYMAEVPLGRGVLDLPRLVATVRKASPKALFHLEMITRDPLLIPCLTEKYWQTLGQVPGQELSRALARIRAADKVVLPRITALTLDQQLAAEDANIRESFQHAVNVNLIGAMN